MRLDDVRVAIRPRDPWEAVDLGFTMARAWAAAVWLPFLLAVGGVFAVLSIVLYREPHWVLFALWWLKPLFDRVVLVVLSRAVFGAPPGPGETLRAARAVLGDGLWLQLSLLRFDTIRSLRLPVLQLERLAGPPRRERVRVLFRRGRSQGVGLTFVCLHLELMLGFALLALITFILPQGLELDVWTRVLEAEGLEAVAWNALLVLPFCLLEPFYVGGGFALYLSRRAELEGWDLELRLRRVARRLAASGGVAASLLGAALWLAPAPPAAAALSDTPLAAEPLDPRESDRVAAEVLAHEDFDTSRSLTTWRWRGAEEEDEGVESPAWLRGLLEATGALARVLEAFGWALLALVAGWLLWQARHWVPGGWRRPGPRPRARPAQSLSGLDLRPESLPADPAAEARELWRRGAERAALSLVYRACLSRLVQRYTLDFGPAATEGEVIRRSRARLPAPQQRYLERATALWQGQAYAHRRPSDADFEALLERWPVLEGGG